MIYEELGRENPHWKKSNIYKVINLTSKIVYYYKKYGIQNKYNETIDKIKEINNTFVKYGKRRISQHLRREYNIFLSLPTIAKLMRQAGIQVEPQRKRAKYSSYQGEVGKLSPNLLNRDISTTGANEKIVTDVTEFQVCGQKLYLSAFLDLHGNRLIGYTLCANPTVQFVVQGLQGVIEQLPPGSRAIIHSDQGHQYQHAIYRELIDETEGLTQSMSRKGNCLDNASCESFFGRLKDEIFEGKEYKSLEEFIKVLTEYLEFYNYGRVQIGLGGLTPMEYTAASCTINQ